MYFTEKCFNPCFNGSVERGKGCPAGVIHSKSFNPCFNGSVERGWLPASERRRDSVSILVLMEVLREADIAKALKSTSKSFNPCFNGSVERGQHAHPTRARPHVSILVLMEVLREVG